MDENSQRSVENNPEGDKISVVSDDNDLSINFSENENFSEKGEEMEEEE
jgi:hypothetical protein